MTTDTINDAQTVAGNGEGTILAGRYRIVRQLGAGGMGSVWLAEDTQLDNKQFAIKMLPAILVANKRAYRQLKDEALVAMRLVHPNIVQIRAFEENNGNPFLVMDYVDGQTLDDYLAEKGTLTEEEVIRVLRPIAAALDYAHGEGVVHRDVKPANVMIRKDGHPFILDFGIAREIQETMTRVTGKLSSGTLLYMSPEQLRGRQPRPAQDVYSFAAMAYECLKGEPPFSHGQIEFQIMNKEPGPLPGGPRSVAAAIMAGLAKKPEDRPSTCAGVLEGQRVTPQGGGTQVGGGGESPQSGIPRQPTGHAAPDASHCCAWKRSLIFAVLGLVAVACGVWCYRQEQKEEQARIAVEAARQKASIEEANRKAEEAVRQKAAATEVRINARVQQSAVGNISGEDGFRAKKDDLDKVFARADALFDEKVKRWIEAAQEFSNYVVKAEALIKLDGDRLKAVDARRKAEKVKNDAKQAYAEKYASTSWDKAVERLEAADAEFVQMQFASAANMFVAAVKQFELCVDESKAEREKAAARAKAEQEAREREKAEARAKAEREAREREKAEAEREAREREKAEARAKAEREARERERRARWRKEGEEFTINDPYSLHMTMKWCPAGRFTMGSAITEEGRYDNERQHEVTLTKGFWMGQTEVTQGQWKKIMGGETIVDLVRKGLRDDTRYDFSGGKKTLRDVWGLSRDGDPMNRCGDLNDDVPVYNVSWNEAVELCRRLTQRERAEGRIPDGYEYRLPTEAEWEYACRAGTTESLPNGRNIRILGKKNAPALDDIAWNGGNSSRGFDGRGVDTSGWPEKQYSGGWAFAREVKGKQPNNWGLYDMIGNVWEWCGDWYEDYPYGSATDPTGAATGMFRVSRGGGWDSDVRLCRAARRGGFSPGIRNNNLGFRVALAPMSPEEYRKAIQEELQTANVVTRYEQYPAPEVKRENQPEEKVVAPTRSEKGPHDKVQLWAGGPYWATMNIGANRPEEYGYYFWWGDTVGYKRENNAWVASDGSSSNFSFCKANTPTSDKSVDALKIEGWITVDDTIVPEHDVAYAHWGGNWRMPTKQELDDLWNKCDWELTMMNGVNGYVVRGRGDFASAGIFLPCAGFGYKSSLHNAGSYGRYWSSVPLSDFSGSSWYLYFHSAAFHSDVHSTNYGGRSNGQSVRPVQGFAQ